MRPNERTTSRATENAALHAFGSYDRFVYCLLVYVVCSSLCRDARRCSSLVADDRSVDHKHPHLHPSETTWRFAARQSLCAEMASELRFAVRCGSRQRPAAKSRDSAGLCGRCSPHATGGRTHLCSAEHEETTYIPSIEIPRLNGVSLVPHDTGSRSLAKIDLSARVRLSCGTEKKKE